MTTYIKIDADHYKAIDEEETPLVLSVLKARLLDEQTYNANIDAARLAWASFPDPVKAGIIILPRIDTQELETLIATLEAIPGAP